MAKQRHRERRPPDGAKTERSLRKQVTVGGWVQDASLPSTYYRCDLPAAALQRAGLARYAEPPRPAVTGRALPRSDIVILSRNAELWRLERIPALQARGALVVADEDDARMNALQEHLLGYGSFDDLWESLIRKMYVVRNCRPCDVGYGAETRTFVEVWAAQRKSIYMQDIAAVLRSATSEDEAVERAAPYHDHRVQIQTFQQADLLTVSTSALAQAYSAHNPSICVLPNCIDLTARVYHPSTRARPHTGVIIGWAGGGDHLLDLELVYSVLDQLMSEYDGTGGRPLLRLMLGAGGGKRTFTTRQWPCLDGPEFARRVARDSSTGTMLRTVESPCGRYLFRPTISGAYRYPQMYSDIDIGIVPNRVGHLFYAAKSDVKGLEMAGMGVPCVASPIPAYQEWRAKEGTGAIVVPNNEPESWLQALRLLIEADAVRRRMADEALAFAQTRSIDAWAPRWMEAYEEAARRTGKTWAA